MLAIKILLLVLVANGTPVVAAQILRTRLDQALDGDYRLGDGRPVFGPSKTVRGVVVSITATALAAPLLGIPIVAGIAIGLAAISGDLFSSFVKRRLGIPSSGSSLGLDQIPESLVPLLVARFWFELGWAEIAGMVLVFILLDLALPRLLLPLRRK